MYKATVSVMLAGQLALSLSVLPTLADGESLTNTSLALPPPSPSNLVQRVWNSLDVQQKTTASNKQASGTTKRIAASTRKSSTEDDAAAASNANAASNTTSPNESARDNTTSTANQAESKSRESASATLRSQAEANTNSSSLESKAAAKAQTPENKAQNEAEQETTSSRGAITTAEKLFTGTDSSTKPVAETTDARDSASPNPAAAAADKNENSTLSVTETTKESEPEKNNFEFHKPTAKASGSDRPFQIASALGQVILPPGSVLSKVQAIDEGVVVIDNDEAQEVQETLKCEELAVTGGGASHARAGARFPVVLASQITSKTAKVGDPLKAHLKYDLKIADRLVAKKGSVVNGHINYVLHARTIMHSFFSPERWYRNSGCIGLTFDDIVNEKGEHLPLEAVPSRQARIVKNKAEGRELGVNHNGQVVGPWSEQIKYKVIRLGLNAAMAPAGVFTFGAMPVALGVLGAASPSFAFAKPVGLNVRHRRLKGFAWGFLSGVPGSFLIEDTTIKGQEAIVKPGDEFYAELVQEFTGEPASDAQLMSGTKTKVHGEVLKSPKKAKKNTP